MIFRTEWWHGACIAQDADEAVAGSDYYTLHVLGIRPTSFLPAPQLSVKYFSFWRLWRVGYWAPRVISTSLLEALPPRCWGVDNITWLNLLLACPRPPDVPLRLLQTTF